MFQMIPKQQHEQMQMLSKVNFLALETIQTAIQDSVTCQAYLNAIKSNQQLFHQKIVLHLTTGCNCLYSIFAANVGAAKVYCVINGHSAVDQKNLYMMRQIIKENELDDIVEVLSFKNFNAEIDILIGQPMGYNLIYDGMLDRMIQARDLYLRPQGLIFPNALKYKCAFIRDDHFTDHKVSFWGQVYGIPMNSMKQWISSQPVIRTVDPTLIVSDVTKFLQFNLEKVSYQEIDEIKKNFGIRSLTPPQNANNSKNNNINQQQNVVEANGITIWFEIQFTKGLQKVQVKASPWSESTRWTHMTLYSNNKMWKIKDGEIKHIKFIGKKQHLEGYTTLKVTVEGQENIYNFS